MSAGFSAAAITATFKSNAEIVGSQFIELYCALSLNTFALHAQTVSW